MFHIMCFYVWQSCWSGHCNCGWVPERRWPLAADHGCSFRSAYVLQWKRSKRSGIWHRSHRLLLWNSPMKIICSYRTVNLWFIVSSFMVIIKESYILIYCFPLIHCGHHVEALEPSQLSSASRSLPLELQPILNRLGNTSFTFVHTHTI